MLIDGRTLRQDGDIEATVCIVGSGPAGLTLAMELMAARLDVLVLESGGVAFDAAAQDFNAGAVVGDPYQGLQNTRHRQLGGTIHAWNTPVGQEIGAKFVPLDRADIESAALRRDRAAWPISWAELESYYRRAHEICGLGRFDYGADAMGRDACRAFDLSGTCLESRVYRFGLAARFLDDHMRLLCSDPGVRVYSGATVCGIESTSGPHATALRVVTSGGAVLRVRARCFVLATGAIENARLLLLFKEDAPALIEDAGDWIGRCFMEHPRDSALTLVSAGAGFFDSARFYDLHESDEGVVLCGRLAPRQGEWDWSSLPNMSITLLPRVESAATLLERWRQRRSSAYRGGHGWASRPELARRITGFRLLTNLEQGPRPDNRITLGADRDRLGRRRAELHWRWHEDEQQALVRLRALVAAELERAGVGRVEIDPSRRPDPNAHHHAGTTRMAVLPTEGVVDATGRVFGCDNLFVTGASLLPTAGFANPTLTVVALASRLAARLLSEFR
jgi:choline dehydrogenase-like flavoprotein